MRALVLFALGAGCVNGFSGSSLEIDFSSSTVPLGSPYGAMPGDLPSDQRFVLYAFQNGTDSQGNPVGRLFDVATFEIRHIVDLASPCFIDVGPHVPHPGLHVSQYKSVILADNGYNPLCADPTSCLANPPAGATMQQMIDAATAVQRDIDVQALAGDAGIKVVVSASASRYGTVATSCSGPADQIPPPTCTDAASNALRLQLCQAAWSADTNLYEGTDRVLTVPLNGTTYGDVDGINPVALNAIGGAGLYVNDTLDNFDGFAIYQQTNAGMPPGTLVLFGTPTAPTRGVIHVHFTNPANPLLFADMGIFSDLGNDNVQF
jgi:hypothetical protein